MTTQSKVYPLTSRRSTALFDLGPALLFLFLFAIFSARASEYDSVCYIQFAQSQFSVCKNESNATITVTRTGDFRQQTMVDYEVADGTATAGEDYKPVGGQLVFAPFENRKTFVVPIIPGPAANTDQTVRLTLLNPTSHTAIVESDATLVITAATPIVAAPPAISISAASQGMISVSWPGDRMDCVLERTDDPTKPWTPVSETPYQLEGRLIVEEATANVLYLYRLRLK